MSSYTVAAVTFQVDQARMDAFNCLDRQHQELAIRRMADTGWSDYSIATATGLVVEQVRRVIGERRKEGLHHA